MSMSLSMTSKSVHWSVVDHEVGPAELFREASCREQYNCNSPEITITKLELVMDMANLARFLTRQSLTSKTIDIYLHIFVLDSYEDNETDEMDEPMMELKLKLKPVASQILKLATTIQGKIWMEVVVVPKLDILENILLALTCGDEMDSNEFVYAELTLDSLELAEGLEQDENKTIIHDMMSNLDWHISC